MNEQTKAYKRRGVDWLVAWLITAALAACAVGFVAAFGAMLYLIFRESENETALWVLTVIVLVQAFTFAIAQGVLGKKM